MLKYKYKSIFTYHSALCLYHMYPSIGYIWGFIICDEWLFDVLIILGRG